MTERIIQFSTFEIHEGKLAAFKRSIRKAVEFAEEHGPQLLVDVFVDEDKMCAYSCQIQRDSEAILAHWELSDPYIQAVMENCRMIRHEVYGEPSKQVLDGIMQLKDQGIAVNVTPGLIGFMRDAL